MRAALAPALAALALAAGPAAQSVAQSAAQTTGPTPSSPEWITFQSPSGNIRCVMTDIGGTPSAACRLDELTRTFDTPPDDCDGDWGAGFAVEADGPGRLSCYTDLPPEEDARVLPYGVAVQLAGITCASERTGVTCTNEGGGGFSVRRAEQSLF